MWGRNIEEENFTETLRETHTGRVIKDTNRRSRRSVCERKRDREIDTHRKRKERDADVTDPARHTTVRNREVGADHLAASLL